MADVEFLVRSAPHDALREGREFSLFEGSECVARGRVLSERDALSANPAKEGCQAREGCQEP